MIQTIYNNYNLYHKRKEIEIIDIPFQYRRLCYELHGLYIQDKKNINYSRVYDYIISLQVPRILHAINYDTKSNKIIQ